jgi:hypothetical protein
MHIADVRRDPDGAIDFDFYRQRAAVLRQEALRDFLRAALAMTNGLLRWSVADLSGRGLTECGSAPCCQSMGPG